MTRKGDWMQTRSGRQFWPLNPRADEVHIEDIAGALSKLCRYGGQCLRFYSVAEHSVLMASRAPRPFRFPVLMHDATEAYLNDVIRPLKAHLINYKTIEAQLERVIAERFELPWPMPPEVKRLDEMIVADEKAQVMAPAPARWAQWDNDTPALGVTLQFWSPDRAEAEFMRAFREYSRN